jgi:hypothetical protein
MSQATIKVFLLICGIVGGWMSAVYSIDAFGSSPVSPLGSWRAWNMGAGTASNLYSVAHYLLAGQVPPAESHFRVYSNTRDDEGNILRSECVYLVSTDGLQSRWWSLSLEPADIADKTSSAVITSDQVARAGNGNLVISVARHPVPGNWVRPAHDGNMEIQLLVSNDSGSQAVANDVLPSVQRVGC